MDNRLDQFHKTKLIKISVKNQMKSNPIDNCNWSRIKSRSNTMNQLDLNNLLQIKLDANYIKLNYLCLFK